jgi:hypothetical protein
MLKHVLVMMLLAPRALVWGASDEATWGKGLEVDSTTSLPVLIEELSEEAKNRTQPRTNRGSCQSIAPKGLDNSGEQLTGGEHEGYLLVRINVFAGGRFATSISFQRWVFYLVGGKVFKIIGSTWMDSGTGISGGSVNYILDRIAEHVEVFCNEFLKANGK